MYYYSFNGYLRKRFGERVHKISLNAGLSCPNKDGTLSRDGCIFCNEDGFSDRVRGSLPIEKQIEDSIDYYGKRMKVRKFIAYFQNASNTHGEAGLLKRTYDVIRKYPQFVGLSVSTRPDCIDEEKLDILEDYSDTFDVWIEYGIQTIHRRTLEKIGRNHSFPDSERAIEMTRKRNIKIGVHIILGLPGESHRDMMETAERIAELGIDGVKLHVLHVIKDTALEKDFAAGRIRLMEEKEYVGLACDFLERQRSDSVVLRIVSDAKKEMLIAPLWINEKQKIIEDVRAEFKKRNTKQGSRYEKTCMRIR